ncbi:DUF4232 domain-containing protein [Curtobacterium sp. MCBD17_013]|uniref:DUF4232 domain-containing protein n=1 Tax=Curtobacterium sp. MCBD17_013 TaxID=2175668 RepID=UPI0021ABF906|nr:DUF4232 domain-containing protein [Curtobacterium sp. MCBD17_013]
MKTTTMVLTSATALAAVIALTGCAGSGSGSDRPTITATRTATATTTTTATASPSVTAGGSGTGGSGTGDSDGSTSAAGGRCTTDQLSGGTAEGTGGAAGSVGIVLTLTNTGTTPCTLQGWPGVSFVGGGDGEQIGAPAELDRTSEHDTVTLGPGAQGQVALKITQAAAYDAAECSPQPADGFRVYPPGSKTSLFIKDTAYTACASGTVHLLTTGAVVVGPAHP